MILSGEDITALFLTMNLAFNVTVILILVGSPLAWWLARTRSHLKAPVSAIVALPLVLPPTVLGFYLLVAMGPEGPIGKALQLVGIGTLAFSYPGLVFASVLYSLPFVVQPLQNAFESIGSRPLEVAATLGAGTFQSFFLVAIPMAKSGFFTAAILGFAHTVGEFGVVLMIGGNIPGQTRVVSVQIYDHVEALAYDQAHQLSLLLVLFSFTVLVLVYAFQRRLNRSLSSFN